MLWGGEDRAGGLAGAGRGRRDDVAAETVLPARYMTHGSR